MFHPICFPYLTIFVLWFAHLQFHVRCTSFNYATLYKYMYIYIIIYILYYIYISLVHSNPYGFPSFSSIFPCFAHALLEVTNIEADLAKCEPGSADPSTMETRLLRLVRTLSEATAGTAGGVCPS